MMTTYKYLDGRLVWGEFTFMTAIDYFEEEARECDLVEVVEEVWVLESRRVLKLGPTDRWCEECDEDIVLREPIEGAVWCPEHWPPGVGPAVWVKDPEVGWIACCSHEVAVEHACMNSPLVTVTELASGLCPKHQSA